MALKRTIVPFYGKRETRLAAQAQNLMRTGRRQDAEDVFNDIDRGMQFKRAHHQARGGRTLKIRTAGRGR